MQQAFETHLVPTRRIAAGPRRLRRFGAAPFAMACATTAALLCGGCSSLATFDPDEHFIPADDIEQHVEEQMELIERAYLRVDDTDLDIVDIGLDDNSLLFLFEGGLVSLGFDLGSEKPTGNAAVLYGELPSEDDEDFEPERSFVGKRLRQTPQTDGWRIEGELRSDTGERVVVDFSINEAFISAGTTQFEVSGRQAELRGILGTRSYAQLGQLIENHPEVDTIVFIDVPGSMNDAVNMHTGRLLRKAGLATRIDADGMAASGGVDLFAAGSRRTVERGARLGVHSWCCVGRKNADQIPRDHPAHTGQRAYFSDILGDRGEDFYFFTLESAGFDDIHWMTPSEIKEWVLATDWLDVPASEP